MNKTTPIDKTVKSALSDSDNTNESYIHGISEEIDKICRMLSAESKDFDISAVIDSIRAYIRDYERWMYSDVSNYLFIAPENKVRSMISNINQLVSYLCSDEFEKILNELSVPERESEQNVKNKIIKLYDHINLANKQYGNFNQTEDEKNKEFNKNIALYKEQMTREFSTQLISLMGIFTAMAFLVFGGINSLDNIFAGVIKVPIVELLIIGCVWGLCITNLIFVFMFFVAKLTKLEIKSDVDINAGIVKKYPLICWTNLVQMTILLICCWIYYIDCMNIGKPINDFIQKNSLVILPLISFVIIFSFIGLSILILGRDKGTKRKIKN